MTLTFDPTRAMGMVHTGQSQRSLGSKVRLKSDRQIDGQTDGGDCIISHANAVSNKSSVLMTIYIKSKR